ncbi:MAG: hypothetical protein HKN57_04535 [Xanthomonadales bacterium]|nr:hypothetical protein [Xanthomonadales bacterium]NNK52207.1 hypothetical protein [Xanthomonadales bacterium]
MNHGFRKAISRRGQLPGNQKGALTIFSAVLILILLTEMIIYAVQVGVFEQRKSGNEMRQKEAFHVADASIEFGKEFMRSNIAAASSAGTGGWLEAGTLRWQKCSEAGLTAAQGTHPCYAEPASTGMRDSMYYYSVGGSTDLPINVTDVVTGGDATQQVSMHALLCMLEIDQTQDPVIQGCTTDPALQDDRYFLVTLLSRGEADCSGTGGNRNCTARALVADRIGAFAPGGQDGGSAVPVVTRSNFPPTGAAEIVPNPNAGGVGVPISAWMNANSSCPNQLVLDADNGSWATCERHEWYGTDIMPGDAKCPTAQCECGSDEKLLSESANGNQRLGLGIDLVEDPAFPCDLFHMLFGVPKFEADGTTINQESVDFVKYVFADEVLDDCSGLDETSGVGSKGVYWVSGDTCQINANTQIGTIDDPVMLISAAGTTRFSGGASLFGILFVTDVEVPTAKLNAVGTMTIYGQAIIDATLDQYQGTFQVVYVEEAIDGALEPGGVGKVAGGWTDFHENWR